MARPGRKRRQDVKRYPNQQPVRSLAQIEAETKSVAVEARMRHHGLNKHQAKRPDAGSVQGRLLMDGFLDEYDDDALTRFAQLRRDYMRAIDSPPASISVGLERQDRSFEDLLEDVDQSVRVVSEWNGLRKILGIHIDAILAVLTESSDPINRMSLRGGLAALRQHYRLPLRESYGTR